MFKGNFTILHLCTGKNIYGVCDGENVLGPKPAALFLAHQADYVNENVWM